MLLYSISKYGMRWMIDYFPRAANHQSLSNSLEWNNVGMKTRLDLNVILLINETDNHQ